MYVTFFPGAAEIAQMLHWFDEYGFFGPGRDPESGNRAAVEATGRPLLTLEGWLKTGAHEPLMAKWDK